MRILHSTVDSFCRNGEVSASQSGAHSGRRPYLRIRQKYKSENIGDIFDSRGRSETVYFHRVDTIDFSYSTAMSLNLCRV